MVNEKYVFIHKLFLIMQTMAIEDSVCGSWLLFGKTLTGFLIMSPPTLLLYFSDIYLFTY